MEGTPVRGQKHWIVQLNEAQDLKNFQDCVVRTLGAEFKHAEILFGIADQASPFPRLPAWIKSHLERRPELQKKLEQGEMVGISAAEDGSILRPAPAVHSSIVLIPMIGEDRLQAAIGLASRLDGPQLSAEDIEAVRQFAYEAAPILVRLQQLQSLQRQNQALSAAAERAEGAETQLAAMVEDKNMLTSNLRMRSHQQINVAHELRTPLAAIRGYTRMILDGRGGPVSDTQKDYLRIVTENTNRLIALVNWMSYVGELSAQHLKLKTFEFRDLWTECIEASTPRLSVKSLNLVQRIPSEPFVIVGDREKLGYVLKEIIHAAATLASNGGLMTAELSRGRDKELNFKLTEQGNAIPAEDLSRIFERSFNTIARLAAPQAESGTINLSGVYDVIGMHGGRVFVHSNSDGKGAAFLFTLPAVTAGEENSHEQAVNSSRRRR